MKKIFSKSILVILLCVPFFAQTGLIQETGYDNYCVKIENIKDFPDYEFLLVLWPGGGVKRGAVLYNLEEGKCQSVNPGFDGTRRLYAINKNDFKKLASLSAQDFNPSNGTPPVTSIIPFQYEREIGAWGNPGKKYNNIETIIKINKIGSTEGELSRVNINIDEAGKTKIIFKDSWYDGFFNVFDLPRFIIGLVAVLIVVLILINRKQNQKNGL